MIIITKEQLEILEPHVENIDEVVQTGDIQNVLEAIDNAIIDNILGNNDEPDEEGIKLQRVYDEIFIQN